MDGEPEAGAARRDLLWFAAGALAFRLAFLAAMPRVLDSADAIHYIEVGRQFASGRFFDFDVLMPPLYPALGALFHLAVRDFEWAFRLVSLFASVLLVVPVYLLSVEMHGRRTARTAALTVVLWPWLADYGLRVAPEALACALWFAAIWLLVRGLRRGGWWVPGAALAFFGLHLTRPEGTFVVLAALVGALLLCARTEGARWSRFFMFGALACALLALYGFYMQAATGRFMINPRFSLFIEPAAGAAIKGFLPYETGGATPLSEFIQSSVKMIAEVPLIMLGPVLCLFAGVGLFRPSDDGRNPRLELFLLYLALCQWGLAVVSHSPAPRYIMTSLVVVSLWSARGMALVSEQAARFRRQRWLRTLPVAAMVAYMLFSATLTVGAEHAGRRPRQPREYKTAGRWLKDHAAPGLILTRKPQIGFYADMPTTGPAPDDGLEDVILRGRETGARYLVVDERYTAQAVPGLRLLLDPENAPEALRLLASFAPYPAARVVIYEFVR